MCRPRRVPLASGHRGLPSLGGGRGRRLVARGTRITTWYARQFGRLSGSGSERSLAIARTVNALTSRDDLPGPGDFEAIEKPVGRAWVRRVSGRNIWLWYRFTNTEVLLLTLTTDPPIPVDDDPNVG